MTDIWQWSIREVGSKGGLARLKELTWRLPGSDPSRRETWALPGISCARPRGPARSRYNSKCESLSQPTHPTWGRKPWHHIGVESAWGGAVMRCGCTKRGRGAYSHVFAPRSSAPAPVSEPCAIQYSTYSAKRNSLSFNSPIYHTYQRIISMWLPLSLGAGISAKPPHAYLSHGPLGVFRYQLRRHENGSGVIGLIWNGDGGW